MRVFKHLGARHEASELQGIAHAYEHMCFRGSEKYPTERDVNAAAHRIGADINACTTHQGICFQIDAPDYQVEPAFDLLMDLVERPKLLPEAWKREKKVVLEEIATQDITFDAASRLVFGDHWPGRAVIGRAASVRALSIDSIRAWHESTTNVLKTMVVAGSETALRILSYLWPKSRDGEYALPPRVHYSTASKVSVISDHLSGLEMVFPLEKLVVLRSDIGLAAAKVYVSMLNQRLFEYCRSKKGLVYFIEAWLEHFDDVQCVHVAAKASEKNLLPLAREILRTVEESIVDRSDYDTVRLFENSCTNLIATAYKRAVMAEEVANDIVWSHVLHHRLEDVETNQQVYQHVLQLGTKALPTVDSNFGPYIVAAVEHGSRPLKASLKKALAKMVRA